MKRIVTIIIFNLIFALLQTSFFQVLFGNYFNPNLIFALVIGLLLAGETDLAFISGLTGGLLIDIMLFNVIGITSLYLCVFVFFIILLKKIYLRGSFSTLLISIPFVYGYKILLIQQWYFSNGLFLGTLFTILVSFVLYNFYKYFKYDQPVI